MTIAETTRTKRRLMQRFHALAEVLRRTTERAADALADTGERERNKEELRRSKRNETRLLSELEHYHQAQLASAKETAFLRRRVEAYQQALRETKERRQAETIGEMVDRLVERAERPGLAVLTAAKNGGPKRMMLPCAHHRRARLFFNRPAEAAAAVRPAGRNGAEMQDEQ